MGRPTDHASATSGPKFKKCKKLIASTKVFVEMNLFVDFNECTECYGCIYYLI